MARMLHWAGLGLLLAATPAMAGSFTTLGSLGGVVLGAVHGTTLYGTFPYGGAGYGQIVAISSSGTLSVLYTFTGMEDGAYPRGQLAINPAGTLFGAAGGGGTYNGGTIWKLTAGAAKPAFHVIHALGGPGNGIGPNGAIADGTGPDQGLTRNAHGNLFGTTSGGTDTGNGNVFTITPAGQYVVLHVFQSMGDGHCPFSGAGAGAGGLAYGTSSGDGYGGDPLGAVWKVDLKGNLTPMYLFTNGTDGEYPDQSPVTDAKGNVYGTTHVQNGTQFDGAIYKVTPANIGSVLHDFVGSTDGAGPNAPLVLGKNGLLYGTTGSGGMYGAGTLFSISSTGTFTVVHSFTGGADGGYPTGNLVEDEAGNIYGGTNSGAIFKYAP